MRTNKLLLALIFCGGLPSPMSFYAMGDVASASQSSWQSYMPQFITRAHRYISQKTTHAYNVVNQWSTPNKLIVLSMILTFLVGAYYRDQIIQLVQHIRAQNMSSAENIGMPLSPEIQKELDDKVKGIAQKIFGLPKP